MKTIDLIEEITKDFSGQDCEKLNQEIIDCLDNNLLG